VRTNSDNGVTWNKAQTLQPVSEIGNQLMRSRDGTICLSQDVTTTSLTISRNASKTWAHIPITERNLAHRNGSPARHARIPAPIVEFNDGHFLFCSFTD
jgi:hypothetical protein